MHATLDLLLAQVPRLYARLIGLRAEANLEKIAFLALLRRGDVILEVGANVGYYTTLFSHLVGRTGHVHAFEPVPASFERLRNRARPASRYHNLTLNELALGEKNGVAEMFWPAADPGQASLIPHHLGSWQADDEVRRHGCQTETLDSYAQRRHIEQLDFIKCDVEGAELAVLRGGIETLRRFTPLLHVEVCPAWVNDFGRKPAEVVPFLQQLGYQTFVLVDSTAVSLVREPEVELASLGLEQSINLVCASERNTDRVTQLRQWSQ